MLWLFGRFFRFAVFACWCGSSVGHERYGRLPQRIQANSGHTFSQGCSASLEFFQTYSSINWHDQTRCWMVSAMYHTACKGASGDLSSCAWSGILTFSKSLLMFFSSVWGDPNPFSHRGNHNRASLEELLNLGHDRYCRAGWASIRFQLSLSMSTRRFLPKCQY